MIRARPILALTAILLIALSAFAHGEAARPQCSIFPLSSVTEAQVESCKIEREALGCEFQFASDQERANLMVRCDRSDLATHFEQDVINWTSGCLKGADIVVGQVVTAAKSLYEAGKLIPTVIYEATAAKSAELATVDSLEKKRDMVIGVPSLEALPDQELDRLSPWEITYKIAALEQNEQVARITNPMPSTYNYPPVNPEVFAPPAGKNPIPAIVDFLTGPMKINPKCMHPQARAAYQCLIMGLALTAAATEGAAVVSKPLLNAVAKRSPELLAAVKRSGLYGKGLKLAGQAGKRFGEARRERLIKGFVSRYKNKKLDTATENRRFISALGRRKTDGQGVLVEESPALKEINKRANDPAVADSIVNRYKESLFAAEQTLAGKHGVDVARYRSYKEGDLLVLPDGEYERFLAFSRETHEAAWDDFTDDQMVQAVLEKYGIDPDQVIRGGTGPDHPSAKLAARYGRRESDPRVLHDFKDPKVQAALQGDLKKANWAQSRLTRSFVNTDLMEKVPDQRFPGTSRWVPSQKATELVRKYKADPDLLRLKMKKTFGREISDEEAQAFIEHAKSTDVFATDSLIANQESLSLPAENHGFIAIDLPGIGAANQNALARELSSAHDDLTYAIDGSRRAEAEVTRKMNEIRKATREKVTEVLGAKGDVVNSGDDIFIVFTKPVSEAERQKLIRELSQVPGYGPPRFSTTPAKMKVAEAERTLQHGLSMEKLVRENLMGKIDWKRLEDVTLHFDITDTVRAGEGRMGLRIETRNGVRLTEEELGIIRGEFHHSIRQFNADPNMRSHYMLAPE